MLKQIIKNILEKSFKARNDDTELLLEFMEVKGIYLTEIQKQLFREHKIGKVDINRQRRELRHEFPELEATERTVKARKEKEKEMINIYGSNPAYLPPLEHYTNMF